jgi:RNA polymerase sigma factor (sigma-70 family)
MPTAEEPAGEPTAAGLGEASATLLARARGGDGQALDLLYSRYLSPLRRWARGRLPAWARDITDTDDLVQETLLHSLGRVEVFEPRYHGAFLAYLRRGILNRLRDEIRGARRRPAVEGTASAAADHRPSPLEEAIGHELLASYEAALARLRPEERESIVARVELGLSYSQVAEALGKPTPDAARIATSRALLRLAQEMARV